MCSPRSAAPARLLCLQAYISQLKLEGLALTSDMVYVTQSGASWVLALALVGLQLCLWQAMPPRAVSCWGLTIKATDALLAEVCAALPPFLPLLQLAA